MNAADRPALAAHLQAEITGPQTTYLLAESSATVFRGGIFTRLVPLLDGTRSRTDLAAELADDFSGLAVAYALARLAERGYLAAAAEPGLPRAEAAYWSAHADQPDRSGTTVPGPVAVVAGPGLASQRHQLVAALASLAVPVVDESAAALTIVLSRDYLDPALARRNTAALAARRPWLLVRAGGATSWLGPMLVPFETGCWECLAQRLRFNLRTHAYLQSRGRPDALAAAGSSGLPTTVAAALQLLAGQIARWHRSGSSALPGRLLEVNPYDLTVVPHTLVRRPQCPGCGTREGSAPAVVIDLQERPARFTTDGGHRTESPDTMLRRFGHHVSALTGVVAELRPYATGNDLLTVVAGLVNGGQPAGSLAELRHHGSEGSAGKGVSEAQSRASALGEALERLSGEFTGEEPVVRGSFEALGARAVDPTALLQVSAEQYRSRTEWNRRHSAYAWVPEPFDPSRPINWSPAWSLADHQQRLLPTAFCFYDAPLESGHRFCSADSNGNAAGANLEEAVLQGFLELVERDSVAIWWYNRLRRPAVDLASANDPYFSGLEAAYADRQREFWALDVTTDLGIPSFVAVSRTLDGEPGGIIQGYGAHLDAGIALRRAVTEMNQMLALVSTRTALRSGGTDPDNQSWFTEATVEREPYLRPDPSLPSTSLPDLKPLSTGDLRADIERCVRIVRDKGLDTLVVNQTRADLGIAVVKVVVPGLRHFWTRFAPGRLYEVPVLMGWRDHPLAEAELNPRPVSS